MMNQLILIFVTIPLLRVDGAYFSITDVSVNVPGDRSKYPTGSKQILLKLHAQPEANRNRTRLTYSILNPNMKYLKIHPHSGAVSFTKEYLESNFKGAVSFDMTASVSDGGRINKTSVRVNISPPDKLDCVLIVQDLCYWQTADYRIFENRKPTILGTLSSPFLTDLCPGFKLNYTINKGENRVEVIPPTDQNKSWMLRTRKPLERDVQSARQFSQENKQIGEFIRISTKCTIEDPNGTKREILKNITVHVLDEDDNLPELQERHIDEINVTLNGDFVKKGEVVTFHRRNKLIFIDLDSPTVNNYEVKILNDSLGLFDVVLRSFEDSRNDEAQTVIYCELIFAKTMHVPRLPYEVIFQLNDTNLLPGSGNKSLVTIPIHLLHSTNSTDEYPHSLGHITLPLKALTLYRKQIISVFRSAGPFARIVQPRVGSIKEIERFVLSDNSTHNKTFNVTPKEGILYVQDISLLRKSPAEVRINVKWFFLNGTMDWDELIINIIEEPSSACYNISVGVKLWPHCADIQNPDDCYETCGISTGGAVSVEHIKKGEKWRRCMWRGDRKPELRHSTKLYSTCTPDSETCPDGVCDSLERLNRLICPQDCSEHIQFPTMKNDETGRGIKTARGVCICDNTSSCVCELKVKARKDNKKNSKKTESTVNFLNITLAPISSAAPNLSRHRGLEKAACGKSCLLGILAGGLFLLGAIATIVICWRFDRVHKVRGKFTEENADLSAPLSDYVDRGILPENTLSLNFDMTTSLTQQQGQMKMQPDPKWEFPRSQLIIEQTLGEGEFGRVLRAKAKDISGQLGYSIVAVKTLKEDAREAELSDLLSEYQLLKEVSHPNIIKLLGVSTVPGGPVYLIIEFAQYGSLRSYLRRSRHVKSESQLPTSARLDGAKRHENYDEPKECKVTPKDILSFAWQISNGMAYLSDVKLVHRDLAARNVLLTSDKICKISDFGLTRDIYEDDTYFKRSKGRVPVKWMAPESLSDHLYTTKSDVWSFGIVIWELITLGATPYPGIQVQNLFHLLKSGYRMERPENCSPTLYKIMTSCWDIDPDHRPSFQQLSQKWEEMLGDQMEYLDLTPNAIHNRSYFCTIEAQDENDNQNIIVKEELFEENLESNQEPEKCGDSSKLLDEPKLNNNGTNQLSPAKDLTQGYETPVKLMTKRAQTPTNENPQYYTNMDLGKTSSSSSY
ncbi:PREDICTED: proto-oncogene tyrosine-protein kinase receptor Ret [Nicrophorus vespilloides]|uniref:Proto-oncogene tyrosine-protein kinase receptor Ret n=1 Tax=Nicrophorus vespilloides TaxID=110193 RepID=A0ABM1N6C9_NICVS|nr:PREDICTED: proto-oncogene tyrosine-protein kinase receptor Ret [Nicrophorus vespilloides]